MKVRELGEIQRGGRKEPREEIQKFSREESDYSVVYLIILRFGLASTRGELLVFNNVHQEDS